MPYSALPDHRISYDNDGSVAGTGTLAAGITAWSSGATLIEWQDTDQVQAGGGQSAGQQLVGWWFFPEQREVTAFFALFLSNADIISQVSSIAGSNDTTNGLDGTWETASLGAGVPAYVNDYSWRDGIKAVSFTGGKKTVRIVGTPGGTGGTTSTFYIVHLYGEKVAGQTPNDIVFIDHDTTPGVAYTAPEDFGDRPLGTSVVRQWRVKNTSATLTANGINLQCNDSDFVISTDGVTWVVTINIASLAPGAESATLYVRNTTPAAGNLLGPRFARIVAIVTSWT